MKKMFVTKIICALLAASSLLVTASAYPVELKQLQTNGLSDLGSSGNIEVTVKIQKIRSLEKFEYPNPKTFKKIDLLSDPDFYVKVFINDQEFTSKIWNNTKYIYDPQFSPTLAVPDDTENVSIKIQLWDWSPSGDRLCDISGDKNKSDVTLTYDIKTGHWTGDDSISDPSGYGRLNGCDDGSIYSPERDCEIWFDITQTDPDGDGIPTWMEENVYHTDPMVNDSSFDPNGDGIPITWDWKWGYDPFANDSHSNLDPDNDGLNNKEEYLTSQWDSDPFRQDIFVEFDHMETSPDGTVSNLSVGSKELLNTAFDRYNKVFHLDDGCMGGGEVIPFQETTTGDALDAVYTNYFLHGNQNNWRRGVFRYGLIVYDSGIAGYNFKRGAFVLGSKYVDKKVIPNTQKTKDITYAGVFMHETGHTLAIYNQAVDDHNSKTWWQLDFWKWGPYKSVMTYRYTYRLVDYSDGSRGKNDFNDWAQMDLTAFQRPW